MTEEKIEQKRPIDVIREMNPGVFIPTGQELADLLKEKEKGGVCPRCSTPVPPGSEFCSDRCEDIFKGRR